MTYAEHYLLLNEIIKINTSVLYQNNSNMSILRFFIPLVQNISSCYTVPGKVRAQGGLPSSEGLRPSTYERRAMPMYVTYPDLIQIGIFLVALMGLCYEIFKGRK